MFGKLVLAAALLAWAVGFADLAAFAGAVLEARARLAETEAARKDLTVRAPFDGTVVTRSAKDVGAVASPMVARRCSTSTTWR